MPLELGSFYQMHPRWAISTLVTSLITKSQIESDDDPFKFIPRGNYAKIKQFPLILAQESQQKSNYILWEKHSRSNMRWGVGPWFSTVYGMLIQQYSCYKFSKVNMQMKVSGIHESVQIRGFQIFLNPIFTFQQNSLWINSFFFFVCFGFMAWLVILFFHIYQIYNL